MLVNSEVLNPCKCGSNKTPYSDSDDFVASWVVGCLDCKQQQHAENWSFEGALAKWNKENPVKTIEVWVEGFSVTGDRGPAQLLGAYEASDFSEAVFQYLSEASLENKRLYKYYKQSKIHRIWGCRLFDNEVDARKSFG